MREIDFAGHSLNEIAYLVNDKFRPLIDKGKDMYIAIFNISRGYPRVARIDVGKIIDVEEYLLLPDNFAKSERAGVRWVNPIIEKVGKSDPVTYIKTVYDLAYKARPENDETIGGDVHILRLTSRGKEWIMGEYNN